MGCNCNKDTYNKVDLNLSCGGKNFAVENYFSELVHDWEKEAARYNLGIQELYSIEYGTDGNNNQLNTVTFKYRKGHEIISRTFKCAPQGIQGEPGPMGLSAYDVAKACGYDGTQQQWLESLKGKTPIFEKITVDYNVGNSETGYGEIENLGNGKYNVILHIVKPTIVVSDIVREVVTSLKDNYYNKEDIDDKFQKLKDAFTLLGITLEYDEES